MFLPRGLGFDRHPPGRRGPIVRVARREALPERDRHEVRQTREGGEERQHEWRVDERELLSRRARKMAHVCQESRERITTEWFRAQITELYAPETPEANGRFVRVTRGDRTVSVASGEKPVIELALQPLGATPVSAGPSEKQRRIS